MNDYTPKTANVRTAYAYIDEPTEQEVDANFAAFDRWLAEVERAAAEKAWDECIRAQLEYEQSVRAQYPWNPYRKEQ